MWKRLGTKSSGCIVEKGGQAIGFHAIDDDKDTGRKIHPPDVNGLKGISKEVLEDVHIRFD